MKIKKKYNLKIFLYWQVLDYLQFTPDNLAPSCQRDLLMINQVLLKYVYFSVVSSANNEQFHFSKIKFDSDL